MNKDKYFEIIDDGKLSTSELLQKCKDKFPVNSYLDDKELDKQFPKPKETTTRYFHKTVEADEIHKNKSANNLEKDGVKGITLRERIIMELQYFNETGKHLDIKNVTLCSGSRDSGGSVPDADWFDGGFRVDWDGAGNRNGSLRSREVVSSGSLNPSTLIPSSDFKQDLLNIVANEIADACIKGEQTSRLTKIYTLLSQSESNQEK